MPNRDLIVMGASAGGIEALQAVVAGLPDDIPAAVLVVLHMPPTGGRALERILGRVGNLPVRLARDGEPIEAGRIYVGSGDHHLLVGQGHLHVRKGPRENGHRPAVDPLFRSAAAYYGPRAIGVILSGSLSDGTAGLFSIRQTGGLAVVQDPGDAVYDGMPANALEYVGADYTTRAADMGSLLGNLASQQVEFEAPPLDPDAQREVGMMERIGPSGPDRPGTPSPWPCPDCNGVLWEIEDGPVLRFRCRVGHAWAADTLVQEQGEGVEGALWMALRALEDRASLSRRLAERAETGGWRISASRYREDLDAMEHSIAILRRLLAGERAGFEAVTGETGLDRESHG